MAASYLTPSSSEAQATEVLAATKGGSANAGLIPALNAAGQFDITMFPAGIGPDTDTLTASEAIAAGSQVNIFNNNGTPAIRNAVATSIGKLAHGYVNAAVAQGAVGAVSFDDNNTAVTGLTVGPQFLSATNPGQTQSTPPSGAGVISQYIGVAVSATILHEAIARPIILAQ